MRDPEAGQVVLEQPGHRDVLGEDQHRALLGQGRGEQLVEQVELLGPPGQPAAGLLEEVGRVVADLLEPGEELEHQPAAGLLVGALDAGHRVAHERLVEDHLLAGQPQQVVGLGLVGQLGGDAGIGLTAAQQERADQAGELPRLGRLVPGLDRTGPDLAEGLTAAEQAGGRPVEDRPELGQVVLDRRAGQGDARRRRHRTQGAGRGRPCVLDVLSLVGDDQAPGDRGQGARIAPDRAVGGEDEAGVGGGVGRGEVGERASAAVEAADLDTRGEAADLCLPVSEQGGWTDHQGRAGAGSGAMEMEGDQGDRLAQPHVVGQAGTEAERGDPLEPREALALVVAQGGGEAVRRREGRSRGGVEQLLADRQQAGTEDHLGRGVVDVDDTGERRGHGLRRLDRADQAVTSPARDGRVDDRPAPAQPQHRRGSPGQRIHLGVGERVSAQRHLPVEREQRLATEHALDELPLAARRDAVERRGGLEVAAQAAWPEHVDAAAVEGLDAVLEQADELVGRERHLVGDALLEQALERRPRLRRVAQGERGVGACPVAETVHRGRVVPERRCVADVEGVLLVVHLEHQPAGARDELLLMGLHAEREGDQLGQVGTVAAVAGDQRLEASAERVALGPDGRRSRGALGARWRNGRGGTRHGVDDGVDEPAYDVLGVGRRQPGVRTGLGEPPEPLGVVGIERCEPPHPVAGLELPGRDEAHREQRGGREQAHRRVGPLVGPCLGQDRQCRADRQGDRPAARWGVGELDDTVTRGLPGAQGRRPGQGYEAHPHLHHATTTSTLARPTDSARTG